MPEAPFRVSRFRRGLLLSTPFILAGLAYGLPSAVIEQLNKTEEAAKQIPAPIDETHEPDGPKLYTLNCANCHGARGDGNGVALLSIPARYFGRERYKFANTLPNNPQGISIPSDDDFLGILRRGIPGSSMPSFAHLSESELRAIIRVVRGFTWNGVYEWRARGYLNRITGKDQAQIDDEWDIPKPEKIIDLVYQINAGGPQLTNPGEFPSPTPEVLANGKKVFLLACANCHGPNGKGDGEQVKNKEFVNKNGIKPYPRDLTRGVFNGGPDHYHLYARIRLGIPDLMPSHPEDKLSEKDIRDLVVYVKSLAGNAP